MLNTAPEYTYVPLVYLSSSLRTRLAKNGVVGVERASVGYLHGFTAVIAANAVFSINGEQWFDSLGTIVLDLA